MLRNYLNSRTLMVILAFAIVLLCLWFTNKLVKDIANEEKQRIKIFATAIESINNTESEANNLAIYILDANKSIPAILTNDLGQIIEAVNLPSNKDTAQLLAAFKKQHSAIEVAISPKQYIYYGESKLLGQIRYFPIVLMGIITIFIAIVLIAYRTSNRSIQNRVWVGMSKETAHQLGTPLSSLLGWMEYLRGNGQTDLANEIQKDVDRLQLVADRFSKIGSVPVLFEEDVVHHVQDVAAYMRKRAASKVEITVRSSQDDISILLNAALFNWVIENLIRNALDAMEGSGKIEIQLQNTPLEVTIDITDSGKGIAKKNIPKVFKPGFTTKERGWGLGLSLAKRIIDKYHHGELTVHRSEVGIGTTFRIRLRR
jgi:signal transduction histidine kinase